MNLLGRLLSNWGTAIWSVSELSPGCSPVEDMQDAGTGRQNIVSPMAVVHMQIRLIC